MRIAAGDERTQVRKLKTIEDLTSQLAMAMAAMWQKPVSARP